MTDLGKAFGRRRANHAVGAVRGLELGIKRLQPGQIGAQRIVFRVADLRLRILVIAGVMKPDPLDQRLVLRAGLIKRRLR